MDGELLASWRFVSSRDCGKAICEPEWSWTPLAPMADYDIWYVMDGRGGIEVNGIRTSVGRGTFVLLHPGDAVRAWHDPNDRLTVIYIHFTAESRAEAAGSLPRLIALEEPQWLESLLLRVLEAERWETRWRDEEFDLSIKLALLRLLREEEQQLQESPASRMNRRRIRKVSEYIRQHMRDRLTPRDIADRFDSSPRYLSRLFKRHTGVSLKQLITRTRLERAAVLLGETSMTVAQIGEAIGYGDIFYFSKSFKQEYGVSPLHYRFGGVAPELHPSMIAELERS